MPAGTEATLSWHHFAAAAVSCGNIRGYSDLLVQVFDETGKHVRAAIGVSTLPRNALVKAQMTVEV